MFVQTVEAGSAIWFPLPRLDSSGPDLLVGPAGVLGAW